MSKIRDDILAAACQSSQIKQVVGGTTEAIINQDSYPCDFECFPDGKVNILFLGRTINMRNVQEFDKLAVSKLIS